MSRSLDSLRSLPFAGTCQYLMGLLDNASYQTRSPEWHLVGKGPTSDMVGNANPGPGTYHDNSGVMHDPAAGFSFGSAPARTNDEDYTLSPGPGAYTSDANHIHSRAPGWGIQGKGIGADLTLNSNPGPGQYSPSLDAVPAKAGPAYTMGKSPRDASGALGGATPGPGTYSSEVRASGPAYSIGTGDRSTLGNANTSPGPAAYAPGMPGTTWPAYSLGGTERRKTAEPLTDGPGPGAYSPGWASADAPAYSMGGNSMRSELVSSEPTPGPGAYTPASGPKVNAPAFSMASKGSKGVLEAMESVAPGPGRYTPSSSTKYEAPSYSIAAAPARSIMDGTQPGSPGTVHTRQRATRTTHRPLQWRARPARRNREFLWDRVLGLDHTHQARRSIALLHFPW